MKNGPEWPRATYRLQVHKDFPFDAVREELPYLARLGISHLYLSPILEAAPGSTHGYDVVNPRAINPELGGEGAFSNLVLEASRLGLRVIVDIVPNHMSIAGPENPWWWDVLEHGPESRYAGYFDVEWHPTETRLRDRILLPVLGDHYGVVLERGELGIEWDGQRFLVRYFDKVFPCSPKSLDAWIGDIDPFTATEAVTARILETNRDPDSLSDFLDRQNYRLAYWRAAGQDLGYRRFFDISTLAGLRMEREEVFRETHALVVSLIRESRIWGLRVDHPDGLRDPEGYLERLEDATSGAPVWIEKILERGEDLKRSWPVAGTTGYDFLSMVGGLFVHPDGREPLMTLFREFTGETRPYEEIVRDAKLQVMRDILGSEMNRLAACFLDVCENHRRHRDHTRAELLDALTEIASAMPVYRTYLRSGKPLSDQDRIWLGKAVSETKTRRADLDPALLDFFRELFERFPRSEEEEELVLRFQQVTGSVMAKGVEDTAFYRYLPLVSLNEVGGDPGRFGTDVEDYHRYCMERSRTWPASMLATATHDTKRGEDVRLRIHALSEIPDEWTSFVWRWSRHNERHRTGGQPNRDMELLFYQTLVGSWPIDAGRMKAYMEKAAREAKIHTSWTKQESTYESRLGGFIESVMKDLEFTRALERLVERVRPAAGVHTLAQTLLKATSFGFPDIYQGTELWDLSLVDPDNRRAVDYPSRRFLLEKISHFEATGVPEPDQEGLVKMYTLHRALAARVKEEAAFGGSYEPLSVFGVEKDRIVAFCRGGSVCVAVPRWMVSFGGEWGDTQIQLGPGTWRDWFGGKEFGRTAKASELFRRFPVSLLVKETGHA